MGEGVLSTQLGDLFLLLSQTLAAVGVLWRLPPKAAGPRAADLPQSGSTQEIQEETTDE